MMIRLLVVLAVFYAGMIAAIYLTTKIAPDCRAAVSGWRWLTAPFLLVKAYLATR